MKQVLLLSAILVSVLSFGQRGVTIPMTASPKSSATQHIGLSTITVDYGRPSVISPNGDDRTGKIWGGLVPYGLSKPLGGFGSGNDYPWRAGANENTVVTFSHDLLVEGSELKAGSYGLHIIPKDDSTAIVVFSSNTTSWGSYFYDINEDVLRVDIVCEPSSFTERLTYDFIDIDDHACTIALKWENMMFPIKTKFHTEEIVFANMTDELRGIQGFGWEPPYEAAQYCIDHNMHLDQAGKWLDRSLRSEENFSNLFAKSQLLELTGNLDEAIVFREEALNLPDATSNNWYSAGRAVLRKYSDAVREEQKDKYAKEALDLFTEASKKFKNDMLIYYGLGRAQSALGDYKKAVVSVTKAKGLTEDVGTQQFFDGQIQKLEAGEDIN